MQGNLLLHPNQALVLGVPYSRISSAEQVSGLGLSRQAAEPAAYCAARGWALYDGPGYSDAGVSAYGGKNLHGGALGRFLDDAAIGRFGAEPLALLVEDLDRFSRSAPLAALPVLIDGLLNAGMTISVMGKGRDISASSIKANTMELHELLLWMGAANDFSEKLSRRISHAHAAKRQQLREGRPVAPAAAPAWIDLDPAGHWVLNDYAGVIRRLVAMAADGYGCHVIATTLNKEGTPSPGQHRRNKWAANATRRGRDAYKPVAWSTASVKQLLASPALVGHRQILTPGYKQLIRDWRERCALLRRQGVGEDQLPTHPPRTYEAPQRDYYPALISEPEQAGILLALQRRQPACAGQTSKLRWLAAGLTRCSCGQPIGATCVSRKGSTNHWLRCKGRQRGSGCMQPGIRLQAAQASLLTRLSAATFLAMFDEQQGGERQSALTSSITALANANAAVEQITAAIAAGDRALAHETDSAVLGVLARRQAQQEQSLATARAALLSAQGELQQLQSHPGARVVAAEAQGQIAALLQCFAREADSVDDRRAVQRHLQRMGLTVHLDGANKQLGLQLPGGEIDWQPLAATARRAALEAGIADPDVTERSDGSYEVLNWDTGQGVSHEPPAIEELKAAHAAWEADMEHGVPESHRPGPTC